MMEMAGLIIERLIRGFASLESRVPQILADPREFPRETMMLALSAALLMLLILTFLLLMRDVLGRLNTRRRLRLRRRPGTIVLRALSFLGVVSVIGMAIAALPLHPASGEACDSCHVMEASVRSWRASSHASVACYGCHAAPGLIGVLEAAAQGGSLVAGGSGAMPADSRNCLDCHRDDIADTVTADGITVSHAEMVQAGMTCPECHQQADHAAAEIASSRAIGQRSGMTACMACHDGERASAACDTCHVAGRPSDIVAVSAPAGKTPAPIRCTGCHAPSTDARCVECHGLEMPHPDSFRREHAGRSWTDPGMCAKCHDTASADSGCACHLEVTEHGTYSEWFGDHMTAASVNGRAGCRCHEPSYCTKCHESDPWS